MRKLVLVLSIAVISAVTLYAKGSANPPLAQARPLVGIDIRELTIRSRLAVGPNYSTL